MYYTYILYNSTLDKFYIGHSSNLAKRLEDHNRKYKGKKYIHRQIGSWTLVYSEEFGTRSEAMFREKEIKNKKSKKYIQQLLEQSR